MKEKEDSTLEVPIYNKYCIPSYISEDFIAIWKAVSKVVHDMAEDKGFWPAQKADRNFGEGLALIHSELSEALEGMRTGNPESKKIPGFSQVEEELADVVIRLMDLCVGLQMDLPKAILSKIRHNAKRAYKHGKNF